MATVVRIPSRRATAASRAGDEASAVGTGRAGGGASPPSTGTAACPPAVIAATGARAGRGRPSGPRFPSRPGRSTDGRGWTRSRPRGGGRRRARVRQAEQLGERHEPEAAGPVAGDDRGERPRRDARSRVEQDDRAGSSGRRVPDDAGHGRARPGVPGGRVPQDDVREAGRSGPPVGRRVPGAVRGPEVREHRPPGRPLHDLAGQGEVRATTARVEIAACRGGGRSGWPAGSRRPRSDATAPAPAARRCRSRRTWRARVRARGSGRSPGGSLGFQPSSNVRATTRSSRGPCRITVGRGRADGDRLGRPGPAASSPRFPRAEPRRARRAPRGRLQ